MDHELVLQNVTRTYPLPDGGEITVLRDVSLTIAAGETVAVVGPSGSGKTTLLNLVGALDQPTAGTIRLGATDVTALQGDALSSFRAEAVGFVFQDHHLLPQLTALENVLVPSLARSGQADPAAEARASELLAQVGLTERLHSFPAQMSGGERQRVALARSLVNSPCLLLADEPTGNLDHDTGAQVIELLLALAADQGVTLVMVTHNLQHAARCGRVLELEEGRLLAAEATR